MARRIGIGMLAAIGVALVTCAVRPAAFAADVKMSPALTKLVKAAQEEGQLNVLWGSALGGAEGVRALQAAINRTYGINVKVNYTPGPSMPQMASRTIQEVKAGRTASSDIFIGVEVTIPAMVKADVLVQVPWSDYFPDITPKMTAVGGRALQIVTLFNGVLYNAQMIPADKVPKTMADIFRPEWKGKIASTPYAVGFDRIALVNGFDKVKPIVQKTAQWAGGLIRCGENERIATGEFLMLFLDCGRVEENFLVKNGGPLGHATLDDALATSLWYFAIPKTSAHPNLSILFSGFVDSKEGQAIIDKYGHDTSHLIPGTPAYEHAQSLEKRGLHLLALGPDELMPREAELGKIKSEFQTILRKK